MTPGTKLGPYEILAPLGAGGMGEVFRARDTKLNREVAIKVLPAAFAQDSERMARFQREAQVLAALNHPNIAQVYGMDVESGRHALVMEYVPGESPRGPLPVDDAMAIAKQIGEALEAAHEKGIVHRDLKPANIKVTPEGKVKVLDFGLAKALDSESSINNSPTLSIAATRAGMILGTASYMSPEQAKGKSVDARTDIWAYGCVLYELLTGKQAFPGETGMDAMVAVMSREPDWSALPPGSPVDLLKLCLQKDPGKRLRHIGDSSLVGMSSTVLQAPAIMETRRRSPLPWVVAAALAAVAAAGWYRATRSEPLRPLIRLSAEPAPNVEPARVGGNRMLAISPDGSRIAVTYRGADGKSHIGTRLLNQTQLTPLSGTEDAASPFFSPDGQWIGFKSADGKLKKVAVVGGSAVTICDVLDLRGASWGDDGYIVFASSLSPLMRVSAEGGMPAEITRLEPRERAHRWPHVLPGSRAVLFSNLTADAEIDDSPIDVVSVDTKQRKTVQKGGWSPRFLPTISVSSGHLVYLHENSLFAAPFDAKSLSLTGAAAPVLEDASSTMTAGGDFDFSREGTFVYLSGGAARTTFLLQWLNSSGQRQALQASPVQYPHPSLSPDGKHLAFGLSDVQGKALWVKDLERDTAVRLGFLRGSFHNPVWMPDGRGIIFTSDSDKSVLNWVASDGSGEAVRLTEGKNFDFPTSISPDGKRLAFYRYAANGQPDIYTAILEGDPRHPRLGHEEALLATSFGEKDPSFSPDGRWLAYASNESAMYEVYVRPFPGPGGRWQVSTGGGGMPKWSRDGKELLFEKPDGSIMTVRYTAKGERFTPGVPRLWSPVKLAPQGLNPNYDLAPDGKKIVGVFPPEGADGPKPITHLTFLLNFFDELKRKVPVK